MNFAKLKLIYKDILLMYLKTLSLIIMMTAALASNSAITVLEPLGDQFVQMGGKTTIGLKKYFTGYNLTYAIGLPPPADVTVDLSKAVNVLPGVASTELFDNWVASRLKVDQTGKFDTQGIYLSYNSTTMDTDFRIIPMKNGAADPDNTTWTNITVIKANSTARCTDLVYGSHDFAYTTCMNFTNATNPFAMVQVINITDDTTPELKLTVSLVNQTYTAGDVY